MPTTRKTGIKKRAVGGLKASAEDIQWLRLLDSGQDKDVPPYNKSRLIALGLLEVRSSGLMITEAGGVALAKPR